MLKCKFYVDISLIDRIFTIDHFALLIKGGEGTTPVFSPVPTPLEYREQILQVIGGMCHKVLGFHWSKDSGRSLQGVCTQYLSLHEKLYTTGDDSHMFF